MQYENKQKPQKKQKKQDRRKPKTEHFLLYLKMHEQKRFFFLK